MAITAADVKKLRDQTGAGMMDAKKALIEADGDFVRAAELLRITGAAKLAKRSDRDASNGIVASAGSALIQLGAETDFVAKNDEFVALAEQIVIAVDKAGVDSLESAQSVTLASGQTVAEAVAAIGAKIGEKIELVAVARFDGTTHTYLHQRSKDLPPQVGVLVEFVGADEAAAHNIAMQIASMSPQYLTKADVPEDIVANETRIAEETAREEGKPEAAIGRIVEGRVGAYYKDYCLLEQPSISDEKQTVGALLKSKGIEVTRFVRFAAGS
jgi:elongation factor Ts